MGALRTLAQGANLSQGGRLVQIWQVLYVEDDDDNYLLVERALAPMGGIRVLRAADGEQALEMARSLRPDLILMDLNLPGLDGLAVNRKLKADSQLAGTPVVVLTANVMPGERERVLAEGCAGYVAKPFSLRALRELTGRFLSGANGA